VGDTYSETPGALWIFNCDLWAVYIISVRHFFCFLSLCNWNCVVHRNHSFSGDTVDHATRFIALARVGNTLKQKWLYAFSLIPIDQMRASDLYQETTDLTECPYTGSMLKPSLTMKQVN
jgi:hypothetical protein